MVATAVATTPVAAPAPPRLARSGRGGASRRSGARLAPLACGQAALLAESGPCARGALEGEDRLARRVAHGDGRDVRAAARG
eukprot:13408036-Alexandrium_andersonii.AAC.1